LGSKRATYPLEEAGLDLAVVGAFVACAIYCMRPDVAGET